MGWPLLLLALAGALSAWWWDRTPGWRIMLAWILCCYVIFSMLETRESRHILFWLPPFAYFAAGVLLSPRWPRMYRIAGGGAAALLLLWTLFTGWSFQRPYVYGYQQLAAFITQHTNRGVIMYEADYCGNFTFFLHRNDPDRRFVVLRKLLYLPRMQEEGGNIPLLQSKEDILASLDRNGVRYIMLSQPTPLDLAIQTQLRELLRQPQFHLMSVLPIEGNRPELRDRVEVYEYSSSHPPNTQQLDIPMRSLPNDIVVPMKDLNAW
jgi:hypothetical protein